MLREKHSENNISKNPIIKQILIFYQITNSLLRKQVQRQSLYTSSHEAEAIKSKESQHAP